MFDFSGKQNYYQLKQGLGLRKVKQGTGQPILLCFPFIGGHSLSFKPLAAALPGEVTLLAVDPPGHGWSQGPCIDHFDQLIELYYSELTFLKNNPVHLYGHSLGGLTVYCLAQLLERDGYCPASLNLGAAPLPHRISDFNHLAQRDIRGLAEVMEIPAWILEDEKRNTHFINAIQHDVNILLSCSINRVALETPLHIFYSREDSFLDYDLMFEWDIYGQEVQFMPVQGEHLFVQQKSQSIAHYLGPILMGANKL